MDNCSIVFSLPDTGGKRSVVLNQTCSAIGDVLWCPRHPYSAERYNTGAAEYPVQNQPAARWNVPVLTATVTAMRAIEFTPTLE